MTKRYRTYNLHHRIAARVASPVIAIAMLLCGVMLASGVAVAGIPASPFGRHFIVTFPDTVWHIAPHAAALLKPQTSIIIFSLDTANVTVKGSSFSRTIRVT